MMAMMATDGSRMDLERVRFGAVLLSVGRGETVAEVALVDSLKQRHLCGARLDAVRQESHPSDSLIYGAPNLWYTYCAVYRSGSGEHEALSQQSSLENLKRYIQGLPLQNQVDPGHGC